MTPNPYDQAARFAIKSLDPVGFLKWIVPGVLSSWRWIGWLDARRIAFPGEADRYSDTVAIFEHSQGIAPPVAAAVEIQLRPEGDMSARMAEYCLDIRRELPLQNDPTVRFNAVGIVLNLTGPQQSETWEMKPPSFDNLGLQIRVKQVSLREENAIATLQRIDGESLSQCVLPWVPLMKQADQPDVIEEWKRLALLEANERKRAEHGALALTFAEAADRKAVWKLGLEDWNMVVSTVVEEWKEEARVAVTRKHILDFLNARFSETIPASLDSKLRSATDSTILDRWFQLALSSESLSEFQAHIGTANGTQPL